MPQLRCPHICRARHIQRGRSRLVRNKVTTVKRVLDRASYFYQSNGHFFVDRDKRSAGLYLKDTFHTTLHWSTSKLIVILVLMYFTCFVGFMPLYKATVNHCNTDFKTWMSTFFFSVETSMTIGYGASDPFFDDCWSMAILISMQSVIGTILDAIAIGLLYDRLSRATSRANTVLFSRYAIIRQEEDGQFWFRFRVVEQRKHQMVEAHVRCYVVRQERRGPNSPLQYFKARYVRTQDPDDEIGGMLWLVFPMEVGHRMDAQALPDINTPRSPILPTREYLQSLAKDKTFSAGAAPALPTPAGTGLTVDTPLHIDSRAVRVDMAESKAHAPQEQGGASHAGGAAGGVEPSAGGAAAGGAAGGGAPSTREAADADIARAAEAWVEHQFANPSVEQIRQYWLDRELEMVCLVEGIDAVTSDTTQARHSYTIDEVFFNKQFQECVRKCPPSATEKAYLDLEQFHEVM